MAIQILQNISETKFLEAFNNQEVRYKSNTAKVVLRSTITVSEGTANASSPTVSITPNPNGEFLFNFKDLFKNLVNRTNFRDEVFITGAPISFNHMVDSDVFKLLTVRYQIEFVDGTKEELTKVYRVLRSVINLEEFRKGLVHSNNNVFAVLSPIVENATKTTYVTLFEGYPFDFSIYSSKDQTLRMTNITTSFQRAINAKNGVNRVFISTGVSNLDNPVLNLGMNNAQLDNVTGATTRLLLNINKKPYCEGIYLKWFTDDGGWAYYLFQEHKESVIAKETGSFSNNFGNIASTTNTFTSLGYEKDREKLLFVDGLNADEQRYVSTLFASPKVYMYVGTPQTAVNHLSFIEVDVKQRTGDNYSRYYNSKDLKFSIQIPLTNSLTM